MIITIALFTKDFLPTGEVESGIIDRSFFTTAYMNWQELRLLFRHSTGNNVSGPLFSPFFSIPHSIFYSLFFLCHNLLS